MTLFEALTGGGFDRPNWQHSGEFDQNFSKKSNAPGFARGWGWAVLELTDTLRLKTTLRGPKKRVFNTLKVRRAPLSFLYGSPGPQSRILLKREADNNNNPWLWCRVYWSITVRAVKLIPI